MRNESDRFLFLGREFKFNFTIICKVIMEQNWIDPAAIIEINVKAKNGIYTPSPCHVSVSYLQLSGGTDTAAAHTKKYRALRKPIESVAGELGAFDFRENPNTHEFYFTLSSSTIKEIKAVVNRRKAEILAPISKNAPKAFLDDLYPIRVRIVSNEHD